MERKSPYGSLKITIRLSTYRMDGIFIRLNYAKKIVSENPLDISYKLGSDSFFLMRHVLIKKLRIVDNWNKV